MRVTSNMFADSLVSRLGRLSASQVRLQDQISSGQKISSPEDDPAAVRRVMNMQEELNSIYRFRKNIAYIQDRINAAYTTLRSIKNISDRANEIAVSADSLKSPEQLKTYALEVDNLIEQAVQFGNTKYNNTYLFGGVNGTQIPIQVNRDANGRIISVTYNSNETVPEYQISANSTMAVDLPASNASGNGQRGLFSDPRTGADFINNLISLRDHLLAGDTASIQDVDIKNLQKDEQHFILHLADSGVKRAHLQTIDNFLSFKEQSLEENISTETDVDLARAIVKLNQTQSAFLAALQTGATVLNKSLLDYLR